MNAHEAECSVLGAILLNNEALDIVQSLGLSPEDFEDQAHGTIYGAMLDLGEGGTPIDYVSLLAALENRSELAAVGREAIISLGDDCPAACNVGHYAGLVLEHSRKRKLCRLGLELEHAGQNGETSATIVAHTLEVLDTINAPLVGGGRIARALASIRPGNSSTDFLPTGLSAFDRLTGGLVLGELVVLGAYPGHGKSAFACQIALHAATADKPVPAAIFSLEMPVRTVVQRLLGTAAGVSIAKIRRGALDYKDRTRLDQHKAELAKAPLYVEDGARDVGQIIGQARRMIRHDGVRLVVVDYCQLVGGPGADRRLQVEAVIQSLLGLAVATGAVVLACSQLRKRQEGHGTRPTMHDLRETAALFEAPHVVGLLYRPNLGEWEVCGTCNGDGGRWCTTCGGEGGHTRDTTADLLIEKNRSGPTGRVQLSWHGETLRFADLETGTGR